MTPTKIRSDPRWPRLTAFWSLAAPAGPRSEGLRLVTGGPLELTRPIAVSWDTGAGATEVYRGNPNFDGPAMADLQAQATFQRFDREVERLIAAGWQLSGIEGRNLIFERA